MTDHLPPIHLPEPPPSRWRRWLDWRFVASLTALLLVVLVGWVVIDESRSRGRAIDAAEAASDAARVQREAITYRIDQLLDEIRTLQALRRADGERIAALSAEVAALRAQLADAGIRPLVPTTAPRPTVSRSPFPSASPTSRPTATPRPSPTRTMTFTPTPSPTRPPIGCVPLLPIFC